MSEWGWCEKHDWSYEGPDCRHVRCPKCRIDKMRAVIADLSAACEQALATLEHHQADLSYLGALGVVGELRAALAKARGEEGDDG